MNVENYNCFVDDTLEQMPPKDREEWESMIFAADKAKEASMKWIATTLLGKGEHACKHQRTVIHYRENLAIGDIVCWKEFCRDCGKFTDRTGIKRYEHSKDDGKDVIEHESTIYDPKEGYWWMGIPHD
jgi:hypothetical protein